MVVPFLVSVVTAIKMRHGPSQLPNSKLSNIAQKFSSTLKKIKLNKRGVSSSFLPLYETLCFQNLMQIPNFLVSVVRAIKMRHGPSQLPNSKLSNIAQKFSSTLKKIKLNKRGVSSSFLPLYETLCFQNLMQIPNFKIQINKN